MFHLYYINIMFKVSNMLNFKRIYYLFILLHYI